MEVRALFDVGEAAGLRRGRVVRVVRVGERGDDRGLRRGVDAGLLLHSKMKVQIF